MRNSDWSSDVCSSDLGGRSVAERFGATAQAAIVSAVRVAEGPTEGARTPAIAIPKLLSRQGMHFDQIDAIEINEAFAATPLVRDRKRVGTGKGVYVSVVRGGWLVIKQEPNTEY